MQPGIYDIDIKVDEISSDRPAFFVRSIIVGGREVSQTSLEVAEGSGSIDVTVTLDSSVGTISGKALDAADNPLRNVGLALVSADATKRGSARFFRRTWSDAAGNFELRTIIPGDYLLLAWPGESPDQLMDPYVIDLVEKYFVRITIPPLGQVNQDVKLAPGIETIAQRLAAQ